MTPASANRSRRSVLAPALAMLAAGCLAVTINVTFPQEKIDKAAGSIEDLVRMPTEPPKEKPKGTEPRSAAPAPWWAWLAPQRAEAQPLPELRVRTPEVMAAIESRRTRYGELAAAMAKGCVGENNQGLVEKRPGAGCPGNLDGLIAGENRDRMFIYTTLVEQNNMPPGDIARVQTGFAKANRERVPAGTWIQAEAGTWSKR